MRLIFRLLALAFLVSLFSGCFSPPRLAVQQGNIITDQSISEIRPGMSRAQVEDKLGAPVLNDAFDSNQMVYIYTYKKLYGSMRERRLIVYLSNERVSSLKIEGRPDSAFPH